LLDMAKQLVYSKWQVEFRSWSSPCKELCFEGRIWYSMRVSTKIYAVIASSVSSEASDWGVCSAGSANPGFQLAVSVYQVHPKLPAHSSDRCSSGITPWQYYSATSVILYEYAKPAIRFLTLHITLPSTILLSPTCSIFGHYET
jgi:hypothetical protein